MEGGEDEGTIKVKLIVSTSSKLWLLWDWPSMNIQILGVLLLLEELTMTGGTVPLTRMQSKGNCGGFKTCMT